MSGRMAFCITRMCNVFVCLCEHILQVGERLVVSAVKGFLCVLSSSVFALAKKMPLLKGRGCSQST